MLRESSKAPKTGPGNGKPARGFGIVTVTVIAVISLRVTGGGGGRPRERRALSSRVRCAARVAGSELSVPVPSLTLASTLWAALRLPPAADQASPAMAESASEPRSWL